MQITVTKDRSNEQYYKRSGSLHTVFICLLNKIKSGTYVENGNRVGCKDYIGDSIAYQELGFGRGGSMVDKPIDKSRFCFSIVTHSSEVSDLVIKQSKLLNKLEREAGIPETLFFKESKCYVVIDADPFYNKSTLLTSTIIQIVRSLIYKTSRRNIYTHMTECIANYRGGKDYSYWREIIDSKVDLKFLFNNIDLILNGNPFTACNDQFVKDCIQDKSKDKDGTDMFVYSSEEVKVKWVDGSEHTVAYSKVCNHGSHGISNFCYNVKSIIQSNGDLNKAKEDGRDSRFFSWAANYWLLKTGRVNVGR